MSSSRTAGLVAEGCAAAVVGVAVFSGLAVSGSVGSRAAPLPAALATAWAGPPISLGANTASGGVPPVIGSARAGAEEGGKGAEVTEMELAADGRAFL